MRVLVLTYETPAWPGGGGAIRNHDLLEPLAARHTIRVLSTGGPPRLGEPPRGVELILVDAGEPLGPPDTAWLVKNAAHYIHGEPWLHRLAAHHVRALRSALPDQVAGFAPDLIQIEHGELGPLVGEAARSAPTILVMHNLLTTVQTQLARGAGWESVKHRLEIPVMARAERRLARDAAAVVVTTELDRRRLGRLRPGVPVEVVPNCVVPARYGGDGARAATPRVLFTGSFHYPPNQQAAIELLDSTLPDIRRQVPTVELLLAGQQVPLWLRERAQREPGVLLRADVADVRPLLESAWVAVAPMRRGSGSPLKVLEALAAGVPVVATPRIAESLEVGRDDGVLVTRGARGLAGSVVALLSDGRLRERLGAAGRRTVATRFDNQAAARRLERLWTALAGSR